MVYELDASSGLNNSQATQQKHQSLQKSNNAVNVKVTAATSKNNREEQLRATNSKKKKHSKAMATSAGAKRHKANKDVPVTETKDDQKRREKKKKESKKRRKDNRVTMEPRAKVADVAGPCTVVSHNYGSPSVQPVPPVENEEYHVSQKERYVAGGSQYEDSVDNGVSKPPAEQNEEDSGDDSGGSDDDDDDDSNAGEQGNGPENTSEQKADQGNGELL